MDRQNAPAEAGPQTSKRTIRMTFSTSDSGVQLLSVERLEMITPPQPGEAPQAGVHGGYWFELRDGTGRALAHRVIDPTLLNSVEVHSPDGSIQREFGAMRPGVFEVLLPDTAEARTAVLVGTPLRRVQPAGRGEASGEIARFDIPQSGPGGTR